MAKHQYRLAGAFSGAGSPGNAIAALFNRIGSGKRITIRSVEAQVQSPLIGSGFAKGVLGRGSAVGGEQVTPARMDTNTVVPAGLVFRSGGVLTVTEPLLSLNLQPQLEPNITFFGPGIVEGTTPGGRFRGVYRPSLVRSGSGDATKVYIRPNETLGFAATLLERAALWVWEAQFRLPSGATLSVAGQGVLAGVGSALFSVVNGSTDIVELVSFGARCTGPQLVTPYLMVVPFTGMAPEVSSTASNNIPLLKMDSLYPNAETWLQAISDTPLVPYGVPQNYCAEAGAGAPKGFNYLSTKDFLGPVYRAFFPEVRTASGTSRGDTVGVHMSHRGSDLMARRAGFTLRPGEGLAVVPAAEVVSFTASTAVGANPVELCISFDVENLTPTYLTLNGLQPGSDVVVLYPSGGAVIASVDQNAGTSYTLSYDPDEYSVVDVCVYKPGYIPFSVRNLDLGQTGATIPVSQIADRNYQ